MRLMLRVMLIVCSCFTFSVTIAETIQPELIQRLGAEDFATRKKASEELLKWAQNKPEQRVVQLYREWKKNPEPEVKSRCRAIMREVILNHMPVEGPGFLGVMMRETVIKQNNKPSTAVRLTHVEKGSPADKAGLKINDIIKGVDQLSFAKIRANDIDGVVLETFRKYIQDAGNGKVVELHVIRNKKEMVTKARLTLRLENQHGLGFGLDPGPSLKQLQEKRFQNFLKKLEAAEAQR